MQCDIVRDLLPLYHLESCQGYKKFHQEMTEEIDEKLPAADAKEIDYFKKIRKKSVAVVLLIFAKLFVFGFPVASKDMDMTYKLTDNHLEVKFQLKNGHDLTRRSVGPQFIYNNEHKVIGIEARYKPVWIFDYPLDDVGSDFLLGTEISGQFTNRLIIEYADKTVIFENGELVQ